MTIVLIEMAMMMNPVDPLTEIICEDLLIRVLPEQGCVRLMDAGKW